jgi:LysR family glycine cleavage system transcriptional activator
MTTHRLPPLNALRAFEAAARHLSVKDAADELCVTPGAVSQMLKVLEQYLGVALFRRVNRGIFLTDAGQAYLPAIRNAFRQIGEATRRTMVANETPVLTISVGPFFASAWLVPRLSDFQTAHPDIDVQIVTGKTLVDFERDNVDVAIRHGLGRYPGLRSDKVLAMEIAPVAAPALVERLGMPDGPAALAGWPHVHDAERNAWHRWLDAHGVEDIGPPRGPSFDDAALLSQAVLSGQGAGLLPVGLVAADIDAGRLVRLADTVLLEDYAYYLVSPQASQARAKIAAFRQWLLSVASGGGEPLPCTTGRG